MHNTLFLTALLSATAFADMGMAPAAPASCENNMKAAGMAGGMSDQMVTIVQVANKDGALKYFPDNVQAPVGSIVQFQFNPKNHTVTESSFADPCKPIAANLTSATRPGQKSGFVPVTAQDTDIKVFNMLVNDTKPIWIYCGQAAHCQQGMSMVINQNMADPEKTIENYQAKAAQVAPPPGVTVPPMSMMTPTPTGGDAAAAASSMSMSMSMMSMTTSVSGDPSTQTTAVPDPSSGNSTRLPPGSGAVTSGQASGTPAGLNSSANAQAIPLYAGLFVVAGALLL